MVMTELEKLKLIESAFMKALDEVWFARKVIRTIDKDYNTIYPEGLDRFVSQLNNYAIEYTSKVNRMLRKAIEGKEE